MAELCYNKHENKYKNMTLQELIELVKKSAFINKKQKDQLLKAVMYMKPKELSDLANMLLWAEQQNTNLAVEGEFIEMGMTELFNQFNEQALEETTKEIMKIEEDEEAAKEDSQTKDLLKKLKNA